MKPSGRGCGTCKDRRISCDRGLPTCLQCIRSNRQCQGYGMRLSWPKANDRRRAMLGSAPPAKAKADGDSATPFRIVNTSTWDIEIHHYLTSSGLNIHPIVPRSLSWSPVKSDTDYDLLQYFDSVASNSLTAVSPSEGSPNLRDIIIRVALSNDTLSSTAVLQSLLAFSSLHRHSLQLHAAQLQLSALSMLAASAKFGVGSHEVISHIAALMLLCCFEIQQWSGTSSQWINYISGVKKVLGAVRLDSVERNSDMAALLYWVAYHDVLAQFSLHYWRRRHPVEEILPGDIDILGQQLSIFKALEEADTAFICPGILRLVSEVLNLFLEPPDARLRGVDYKNLLTMFEWRIRKFRACEVRKDSPPGQMATEDSRTLEIFQLALLVFIERASGGSPGKSEKLRTLLNKAFAIFSQLKTWQRQFPLLILGCEARTDEDRMVVLDLISRTEENTSVRSLRGMKGIIQSLWAQDDLAEHDLGYTDKIKAILSSSEVLPSFI